MKILALDSSGLVASVALIEEDTLLAEFTMNYKKTHSQTLMPMLEQVKRMTELDLHSLDAIAVAAGPGSFTGLRIGAATAKGLGLVLHCPVAPVPTVDALARNLYGVSALVCPLMDARRQQVYTGLYHFCRAKDGEEEFEQVSILSQCALGIEELAAFLNEEGREVIFLGDGVPVYKEILKEILRIPYSFAPVECNRQRAASVAALGRICLREGRTVSADEFMPTYLRMSQAEREQKQAREAGMINKEAGRL